MLKTDKVGLNCKISTWCKAAEASPPASLACNQTSRRDVKVGKLSNQIGTHVVKVGTPSNQVGTHVVKVGKPSNQIGTHVVKVGKPSNQVGTHVVKVGEPSNQVGTHVVKIGKPSMQKCSAGRKAGDLSCFEDRPVNELTGRCCHIFHLLARIIIWYPLDLPLLPEESLHAGFHSTCIPFDAGAGEKIIKARINRWPSFYLNPQD